MRSWSKKKWIILDIFVILVLIVSMYFVWISDSPKSKCEVLVALEDHDLILNNSNYNKDLFECYLNNEKDLFETNIENVSALEILSGDCKVSDIYVRQVWFNCSGYTPKGFGCYFQFTRDESFWEIYCPSGV